MAYMVVTVLRWNMDLGSEQGREMARRVQEQFVPLLSREPGFVSYQGIVASEHDRTAVAITMWDSVEHGRAGFQRAVDWTDQHVGQHLAGREVYSGEVIMSS